MPAPHPLLETFALQRAMEEVIQSDNNFDCDDQPKEVSPCSSDGAQENTVQEVNAGDAPAVEPNLISANASKCSSKREAAQVDPVAESCLRPAVPLEECAQEIEASWTGVTSDAASAFGDGRSGGVEEVLQIGVADRDDVAMWAVPIGGSGEYEETEEGALGEEDWLDAALSFYSPEVEPALSRR